MHTKKSRFEKPVSNPQWVWGKAARTALRPPPAYTRTMTSAHFSPAAERNKQPILEVLQKRLPASGKALEIASGTGQHVAWFARHLAPWQWQPTDASNENFASIAAHTAGLHNVHAPCVLDVLKTPWMADTSTQFDAVYCANMIHISPWATTTALMHGAAQVLAPGGVLLTYGPYLEDDAPTAEGNQNFDASLRAQNPNWGIRRREAVEQEAAKTGLKLVQRVALPTNNLLLIWAF